MDVFYLKYINSNNKNFTEKKSYLLILILSRQPFPPSQCSVLRFISEEPHPLHGFSKLNGCKIETTHGETVYSL